jgi:DNA topoisomerase IA
MSIGNTEVFSVGRVQTALLNVIAVRNYSVSHFVPTPYYELRAAVTDGGGNTIQALLVNPETNNTTFISDKGYIEEALKYAGGNRRVQCAAESRRRREKPEKLLNITNLQKKAYKQFGYSPEHTLSAAQKLYEEYKCLSYPRTPSRVMGDNNVELFREKFDLFFPESMKNERPEEFGRILRRELVKQDIEHAYRDLRKRQQRTQGKSPVIYSSKRSADRASSAFEAKFKELIKSHGGGISPMKAAQSLVLSMPGCERSRLNSALARMNIKNGVELEGLFAQWKYEALGQTVSATRKHGREITPVRA